jgi:hypothetical protein
MRRRHNRRIRLVDVINHMYCGYVDGMGYCCTTPMLPGRLLCETHMGIAMSGPFQQEPFHMYHGITNPTATVQAVEASIIASRKNPTTTSSPHTGGTPSKPQTVSKLPMIAQKPPPSSSSRNLKDQLDSSPFFHDMDRIYGPDWVTRLTTATSIHGNENSKKLADYIDPKIGIDYEDALQPISNGENIKLVAAAGVMPIPLVSELMTRESLWDMVPYVRHLLEQKYSQRTDPKKYYDIKMQLVDELTTLKDTPALFETSFEPLYMIIRNELKSSPKNEAEFVSNPIPHNNVIPILESKRIVADFLRHLIGKISNLPEPDVTKPHDAILRIVDNAKKINEKYGCTEHKKEDIAEGCWEWVNTHVPDNVLPPNSTLASYADKATEYLPSFVAIFK